MALKIKTFAVNEGKIEYGPNRTRKLSPSGTKRLALVYFLFPKTLKEDTRRGFQVVEQTATIINEDTDQSLFYNRWENSRYVINNLGLEKRVSKK
jgi:hypothetical protein